jgi:hypothetical protein
MHISHIIVSSLIHGLIYGVIFKLFHNVPLLVAAIIATLGVGALWLIFGSRK